MAGGRRPTDGADLPASGRISQEPRPVTGPRAARTPAPDRCPRSAAVSDCHPRWHRSHAPLLRSPVCVPESGVGASARRSPGPVRCQPQRRRAVPPTAQSRGREKGAQTPGGGRDVGAAFVSSSSQRCRASFSPAQVSRPGHRSAPATWTAPGSWGAAGRGRPRPGGAQFDQRHSVSRKKE